MHSFERGAEKPKHGVGGPLKSSWIRTNQVLVLVRGMLLGILAGLLNFR